jgi:hypothetical protein
VCPAREPIQRAPEQTLSWSTEDQRAEPKTKVYSSLVMQIVKTIVHPDGNRKMNVFQRPDGSFGFEEWHWGTEEECWYPFGKYSIAFIDTIEPALQEIRGRVSWLDEVEPPDFQCIMKERPA